MSISDGFVFHKVQCKVCKHTWLYQGKKVPKCPLRRSKAHREAEVKFSARHAKVYNPKPMTIVYVRGRRLTLDPKLLVNVRQLQHLHAWLGRVIVWRKQQDLKGTKS